VAVCGVGWCASQHIARFLRKPAHRGDLAVRARRGSRPREPLKVRRRAARRAITTRYEDVLAASDVDIVSIATPTIAGGSGGGGGEGGEHLLLESRPASMSPSSCASRRKKGCAIAPAYGRSSRRAAIQPFAVVRALAAERRLARRHPLRAHAVPVRVTDWYSGCPGCGRRANGRITCSPPAATRSMRCAGVRSRADVGERASHALHRGVRMADVDVPT